jgi:hypothetical protein
MSQNSSKSTEEFINALVISFITTTILIVGRNVIELINAKIETQNEEIKSLKTLVDANNDKHRFHLLEIVAENKTFRDDFGVKYNNDMLLLNSNMEGHVATATKRQDQIIKELSDIIANVAMLD